MTSDTVSIAEMRERLADVPDDWRMADESVDARGTVHAVVGADGPCIVVVP